MLITPINNENDNKYIYFLKYPRKQITLPGNRKYSDFGPCSVNGADWQLDCVNIRQHHRWKSRPPAILITAVQRTCWTFPPFNSPLHVHLHVFSFCILSSRFGAVRLRSDQAQSSRQSSMTSAVLSHTSQNRKQVTWTQHVVIMRLTDEKSHSDQILLYLTIFFNSMSNFYPKLCCCHLAGLTMATTVSRASVSFNWPAIVSLGLIVKKEKQLIIGQTCIIGTC